MPKGKGRGKHAHRPQKKISLGKGSTEGDTRCSCQQFAAALWVKGLATFTMSVLLTLFVALFGAYYSGEPVGEGRLIILSELERSHGQ